MANEVIVRSHPFEKSLLFRDSFFEQYESLFNKFFDDFFKTGKNSFSSTPGFPKLDAFYRDDEFVVQLAVPGVEPKNIDVSVVKNSSDGRYYVVVAGEMSKSDYKKDSETYVVRELSRKRFTRSMILPDEVISPKSPDANVSNGLLTLKWKFSSNNNESQVTKISISSSDNL